jgi:hypothetical protein
MSLFNEGARLAIRLAKCKIPRQAASTSARVRGHPEVIDRISLSIGVAGSMRAKAVPNGLHAPMRRCTRRSAEAATASNCRHVADAD